MADEQENFLFKWLRREIWLCGVVIVVTLFITNQINDVRTNQAVMTQKLDTLIAEFGTMKDNLNLTFSDIYSQLGTKYSKKQ